ncbi:MAG: hypothetical protein ACKVS6_09840 [Planctomycetota bacterium]
MKPWMAATAVAISAAPITLGAFNDPQSQGQGTVTTTESYSHVVYSSGSGAAQTASTGASYGRVEQIGVTTTLDGTLSLGSAAYMALGGTIPAEITAPDVFQLFMPAPNAGFAFSEVTIPIFDGMTGTLSVRFDGVLAAPQSSANPDLLKVLAPAHARGPVDVTVESVSKTVTFESGFAYVPALDIPAQIGLGQHLQMRVLGNPGSTFWVMYSESLSAPLSVDGIDGTLNIDFGSLLPAGQVVIPAELPGGATTREGFLEFNMPTNPELVGKTFFVQAATYDPNLSNSPFAFTNHMAISVTN